MNTLPQAQINQVPDQARKMIDRIFDNLTASCPILLTISGEHLEILKQQWILGFAENGIKTFEQVKRGMAAARAKPNGYLPSIGEFISWCKNGNDYAHLGLPTEDYLLERLEKFNRAGGLAWANHFQFENDLEFHLLTKLFERGSKANWMPKETRQGVRDILNEWAGKLSRGEPIPPRRSQLPKTVQVKTTLETDLSYLAKMRSMLGARRVNL
ncbi:MAG: replication protein P [[Actinobacillus] rossii]|uniref:Replication P family protein n=1 Tax=[Actinobacillus] rossii TaxID=123820 RepID=A0A380TZ17_9PAST|nr:replication protein P [[Actinobacillus] rossii]MDY3122862.1 replication protein P [[Actinobacillus] rossii]SUT93432.1 replication P family protein [[Actinobacillus] rossii]SUT93706.1 replication P family protein [[Actinobacillus] rossii]